MEGIIVRRKRVSHFLDLFLLIFEFLIRVVRKIGENWQRVRSNEIHVAR